jgi:hypothetical protein
MAHDPPFDSAWFKWAQAILHTQALEADIDAYSSDGQPYPLLTLRTEYQPKRHGFAAFVHDIEPVPVSWRLRIGDVANNFRAALDHLAWALVTRGKTPPGMLKPRQRKRVYFPICKDASDFNGVLPVKLPGVRRTDIAKVRRGQFYQRGIRNRPRHALTLLADINNGDKHWTIQPIWVQLASVGIEVTHMQDCVLSHVSNRLKPQPLEIGAEVTLIHVRKTGPKPHIEVHPHISAQPTVGQRVSIQEWCAQCGIFVFRLLREFSDQPANIGDVGAILARLNP